jgi:hypothetical protein
VQILMRVDAADDLHLDAWHAEHRWLPSELDRGSAWRSSKAADTTVTGPLARLS